MSQIQALNPSAANIIRTLPAGDNFSPGPKMPPTTLRFSPSQKPPAEFDLDSLEAWELAVILLPVREAIYRESYKLDDIAPAIGNLRKRSLSYHAQRLWPSWEGNYRLDLEQAIRLIRFYLNNGQRCYTKAEMIAKIRGNNPA